MTVYDPQKHHRRSIRLKGYDYTRPGAYFITIVTYQREQIFGEVIDGEMRLSPLGQIVREEWLRSNQIRCEICLNEDEFGILPNHMHGVVWMLDTSPALVGVDGIPPDLPREAPKILRRQPRSLASFIAGFKSVVTSRARRELRLSCIWQRDYYEHIIRSQAEFERIWEYIDNNPRRWEEDQLHPNAPSNRFNRA